MRQLLLTEFMIEAPHQPATNYWRSVEIEEVINYGLPDGLGLDLGCGDGHLMSIIIAHAGARELIGLDVDPEETALARERKVYREVVTTTASQIPYPDNSFDFVFSNSVLEHIENIDSVLLEVNRVLRRPGRFIFTVPGPDFHNCLKGPRFGNRELYLRQTDARCFHLRYWDVARWSEHLQRAGLQVVHQREYLSVHQVQRWEWVANNTSGLLYKMARKKKQPIEIQRQMRMRKRRLPRSIAKVCARLLDLGSPGCGSLFGCLLLEASKA